MDQDRCDLLNFGIVDWVVVWDSRQSRSINRALCTTQYRFYESMSSGVRLPVFGLEIRIHRKPTKGKMAKNEPSPEIPPRQPIDGIMHFCKVGFDRTERILFAAFKTWKFATEVLFKELLETEIGLSYTFPSREEIDCFPFDLFIL
jgi:hypothetical protein